MIKKYEINLLAERDALSKFKYSVKCLLSFYFDFSRGEFFSPSLTVLGGSVFDAPKSKNVKLGPLAFELQKIKGASVLQKDYVISTSDHLSSDLNTIFSVFVSQSLTFKTGGSRVAISFIWALFDAKRQKPERKVINVVKREPLLSGFEIVNGLIDPDFSNLSLLACGIVPEAPLPIKIDLKNAEKFLQEFSEEELVTILLSHLFFNKQNVVNRYLVQFSSLSQRKLTAEKAITDFWGLDFISTAGLLMGQKHDVAYEKALGLLQRIHEEKEATSVNKQEESKENFFAEALAFKKDHLFLLENNAESSLNNYIGQFFKGDDFIGTTGYISLPLLTHFISDNHEKVSNFSLGIGRLNGEQNGSSFLAHDFFNIHDKSEYPSFTFINEIGYSWKAIKSSKYQFFTSNSSLLHAKSYFFNDRLVVGSSNFTHKGSISGNLELSLATRDLNASRKYRRWFNDVKKNGSDIKEQIVKIIEDSYYVTDPEVILDKINDVFLPSQKLSSFDFHFEDEPIYQQLLDHQKEAFWKVITGLEKNNVFMLADDVGLGKTFVAMAVMKYFIKKGAVRPAIIASKTLNGKVWEKIEKGEYRGAHGSYPIKTIPNTGFSQDSPPVTTEQMNDYRLIIIDESHFFRNYENNKKTKKAREILSESIYNGSKLLLMTATPVHNHFSDLMNQFGLGQRDVSYAYVDGFLSAMKGENFREQVARDPDVAQWLNDRMISRSKKFVRENYKDVFELVPRDPLFMKVHVESQAPLLRELIALLNNVLLGSIGSVGLVKYLLLKQLESSKEAFIISFTKVFENIKNKRYSLLKEQLFEAAEDGLREYYEDNKLSDDSLSETSQLTFNEDIYLKILRLVDSQNFLNSKRLCLDKIVEEHAKDGVLIFTTSRVTSEILFNRFKDKGFKCGFANGNKSDSFNPLLEKTEYSVKSVEDVLYFFSPLTQNKNDFAEKLARHGYSTEQLKLDILILTDKFSEGINLQENTVLVNYDLPWTPVILQQRLGRLDRIRPEQKSLLGVPVEVFNFIPQEEFEVELKQIEKMIMKHRMSNTVTDRQNPIDGEWSNNLESLEFINEDTDNKYKKELHSHFQSLPYRSANFQKNVLEAGWFTAIKGEKNELYNLVAVGQNYYLLSGMQDPIIDKNINLMAVNATLREGKNKLIKNNEHEIYVKYGKYDEFNNALETQLKKLSDSIADKENNQARIIATVFVMEEN